MAKSRAARHNVERLLETLEVIPRRAVASKYVPRVGVKIVFREA